MTKHPQSKMIRQNQVIQSSAEKTYTGSNTWVAPSVYGVTQYVNVA